MDLSLIQIYQICLKVLRISDETKSKLPLPIRWRLERNMDILIPIAEQYENIKTSIQNAYFGNDEKSIVTVNENGEKCRQIKEEYREEFDKKIEEFNQLGSESYTLNIRKADIGSFIDSLGDVDIPFEELDALAFMDEG